jgi:hypothetical protein
MQRTTPSALMQHGVHACVELWTDSSTRQHLRQAAVATGQWLAMARRVAIFVAIVLAVTVRGQQWPDQRVSSVANKGMK